MGTLLFRIEPLARGHDRRSFHSGSPVLDRYLREQAAQDVKRRLATCFVAVDAVNGEIAGFYTLTAASIALHALVPETARRLPRYPVVPAALLGRLAVAQKYQGQGLGSILVSDALLRAARAELGVFAFLVDAKDEAAERFYDHLGFTLLAGEGRRLCLPVAVALRLIEGGY